MSEKLPLATYWEHFTPEEIAWMQSRIPYGGYHIAGRRNFPKAHLPFIPITEILDKLHSIPTDRMRNEDIILRSKLHAMQNQDERWLGYFKR